MLTACPRWPTFCLAILDMFPVWFAMIWVPFKRSLCELNNEAQLAYDSKREQFVMVAAFNKNEQPSGMFGYDPKKNA